MVIRQPRRVKKSKPSKKIRIKNEQKTCSCCGEKINLRSTTERNITNLEEKVRLSLEIGYCENEACSNYKIRLRPIAYMNQIIPQSGYGVDVFGLIGELRFEKNQTVSEIEAYLQKHYGHIEIKERHLENVINDLDLYISESGKNANHLRSYFGKIGQEELDLSIDGVQPEQGHNILYIVREVLSGKILFAHYSTHSDEEHISKEILTPLKSVLQQAGLKVRSWIADKELALGKAIQIIFKGVPFQHCQSHFLAAMKKPLTQADTELGKQVKKTLDSYAP